MLLTAKRNYMPGILHLLVLFTLIQGAFLFQNFDSLEAVIAAQEQEREQALWDAMDENNRFSLLMVYINLFTTFANVVLIGIAIFHFIPALEFWGWWKKFTLRARKKWNR